MIVELKQKIVEAIQLALKESYTKCKVLSSNFDEDTANVPQTSAQIQVLYDGSEWSSLRTNNAPYYRTLNFTIRLAIKDLKSEDTAQIFNDYILSKLLNFNFSPYYFSINSDSFEKFDQGFWYYVQQWSVGVPNANSDNSDCSLNNYNITKIIVNLSPDESLPLEYDDSRKVEIVNQSVNVSSSNS